MSNWFVWISLLLCLAVGQAWAEDAAWQSAYDAACKEAREGQVPAALRSLEAAFATGLTDVERVLLEPVLESLHGDAKFRSLIRSHSQGAHLRIAAAEEPGQPILLRGILLDAQQKPVPGVLILAFHADAGGNYTRTKPMDEPHSRLFGFLRSDESGRFELRTVYPGYYPERQDVEGPERFVPAHIHLQITTWDGEVTNLQLVFGDDPRLAHETWREWAAKAGHPIARVREVEDGSLLAEAVIQLRK